jgi:hypothetical protein
MGTTPPVNLQTPPEANYFYYIHDYDEDDYNNQDYPWLGSPTIVTNNYNLKSYTIPVSIKGICIEKEID